MKPTRRILIALTLLAPLVLAGSSPAEAGRRSSSSSDGGKGKTTASRSSGSGSSSRASSSASRGSRSRARANKAGTRAVAPRGSSGSRVAIRGAGSPGAQVASGRATYGYYYARGGVPYYHYRPYYWYPSWWFGPYDWAYYGYPSTYYAAFGWRHAYLAYAWPGWYSHWGPEDGWPRDDDDAYVDPDARSAVELDVRPKKATVVLNGVEIGQARDYNGRWDELYLRPGMHEITFRHPGYRTYVTYLEVRPGRSYRIDERLQPGEGQDPRSMEEPVPDPPARPVRGSVAALPAPDAGADDPAGDRTEADDETQAPRTIAGRTFSPPDWEPGADVDERPALRRGLLRLAVQPDDAAVYLDGEFLAHAAELNRLHGAVPVAAGVHRLQIVRPGYVSRTVEIEVEEGGDPAEVDVRLIREE